MTRKLTDFQVQCEKRLTDALATAGISVSNRHLAGKSETYIQGEVGSDLTFWIYEDGACIKAQGHATIFENPDFDKLDDLEKAFVDKLIKELK
jgi:hypothetical protein